MKLRCRFGFHRWTRIVDWPRAAERWLCTRCGRTPKACKNCGGQHDPTAFTVVCVVHRAAPKETDQP